MRTLLTAALLIASFTVHAETITLYTAGGSGALKQFYNVPNDAGVNISLIYGQVTAIGSVTLAIDGLACHAPQSEPQPATLTCDDGSWALLSTVIISRNVCVRQGRGQSCHKLYTLQSGIIERP